MRNSALAILQYILMQLATILVSSPPSAPPPPPPSVHIQVKVSSTSSSLDFPTQHSSMSTSRPTSPPPPPTPAFTCNATGAPTTADNDSSKLELCVGVLSKVIHAVLHHVDAREIYCSALETKFKIMENLVSTVVMALDCEKHVGFIDQHGQCPS